MTPPECFPPSSPSPSAALLLVLALAACAGGRNTGADPFRGGETAGDVMLQVDNLNFNDATLHAVSGGSRVRLGTVSGKARQRFTIPWSSVRELSIQIDVLAGDRYSTPAISVSPGERLELTIQTTLRHSILRR